MQSHSRPREFKKEIENIKNILRKEYEVMDFVGLVAGTPHDVYQWDIHRCVATCDVFIAICDFPAIGLGYELGVAIEKLHKPTLALAREDVEVFPALQPDRRCASRRSASRR